MRRIISSLASEVVFWAAWIIIPLIIEIIPAIAGFFVLVKKSILKSRYKELIVYPEITLIIPIYNSEGTLEQCLQSVQNSDYPKDKIDIKLVNNQTKDNSFSVYTECQQQFPELKMQWMNAKQGKSKALNMALFNSNGKYIIHIDSDGKLHPKAIYNMVKQFEGNHKIDCLTGAVLTDPEFIEKTKKRGLKIIRRCEFYEYCQAFLAGRNIESEFNSIYTVSGAFSAFRKSTILKTQLYNSDTVCEDTQISFQIRSLLGARIYMCEDAVFLVDPIDDFNKLYTQRQRWQRGEIEVAHMFRKKQLRMSLSSFSNVVTRLLIFDHTFAFPRMIWYFALICLAFMNYPFKLIIGSIGIIYVLYVLSAFLYYLNINYYLKPFQDMQKYYCRKWRYLFLMPIYNLVCFFIRLAGIVNAVKSEQTWRTRNLTEEANDFKKIIRNDFSLFWKVKKKAEKLVNRE